MTAVSSQGSVVASNGPSPPRAVPWVAAIVYAIAAVGQIPLYFIFRAASVSPEEQSKWAGTTPFDQFLGPGLIYYGSAAACAFMLIKRSGTAIRPAWFVVVWVALQQVAGLRSLLQGKHVGASLAAGGAVLVMFVLLALHLHRLRRQGVLQ